MDFGDFKDSFSYGERTDLSFKFLKHLSEEEAAEFLRSLLEAVGDLYDDADPTPIIDLAYEWQVRGYLPPPGRTRGPRYDDAPFATLNRPLAEATVVLLTSSGHYVDDPEPFGVSDMTQEEAIARISEFTSGPPQLSEIPVSADAADLHVRHGGFDIRGARLDPNVAFPLDRLSELSGDGVIAGMGPAAFSFVGACSQALLRREALPRWIERIREAGADAVLLVPV